MNELIILPSSDITTEWISDPPANPHYVILTSSGSPFYILSDITGKIDAFGIVPGSLGAATEIYVSIRYRYKAPHTEVEWSLYNVWIQDQLGPVTHWTDGYHFIPRPGYGTYLWTPSDFSSLTTLKVRASIGGPVYFNQIYIKVFYN
jgi:hypothetical protein